MNPETVAIDPPGDILAAVSGADVTLTVEAGAGKGDRRVLVNSAANAGQNALRTIEVT